MPSRACRTSVRGFSPAPTDRSLAHLPSTIPEACSTSALALNKAAEAQAVVIAAINTHAGLREDVQRLDRQTQPLPNSRDRKEQEARLQREIERAKAAMRHSNPSLTANVYTDPKLLDVAGAVASLPDLPLGGVGGRAAAVAVN
jgi:hypothetical protein